MAAAVVDIAAVDTVAVEILAENHFTILTVQVLPDIVTIMAVADAMAAVITIVDTVVVVAVTIMVEVVMAVIVTTEGEGHPRHRTMGLRGRTMEVLPTMAGHDRDPLVSIITEQLTSVRVRHGNWIN